MAIVKRLVLLLLVLSQMTVYSKDELEVVSLLRDFDEDIGLEVFTLMEDYKAHIYQVRNKNKCPEIARFDNPKYAETVYTVIPSEIIRCMLRENPYKDKSKSACYNDDDYLNLMEFHEEDGFVPVSQYTQSNYNFLLLMNVLNVVRWKCCTTKAKDIKNNWLRVFIDDIKNILIENFDDKYDKEMLANAASDIKFYLKELDLYEYLMKLFSSRVTRDEKLANDDEESVTIVEESIANLPNTTENKLRYIRDNKNKGHSIRDEETVIARYQGNEIKVLHRQDPNPDLTGVIMGVQKEMHKLCASDDIVDKYVKPLYENFEVRSFIYELAKAERKMYEENQEDGKLSHMAIMINTMFCILGKDMARVLDELSKEYVKETKHNMDELLRDKLGIDTTDEKSYIKAIIKLLQDESITFNITQPVDIEYLIYNQKKGIERNTPSIRYIEEDNMSF